MLVKKMSQWGEGGASSDDIGWRFANSIPGNQHVMLCKFCDIGVTCGITRLNQQLVHQSGQNCCVKRCQLRL